MLLSNVDIVNKIRSGDIVLNAGSNSVLDATGRERQPGQLQGHGYDLRVSSVFDWEHAKWHDMKTGELRPVHPGEFILVQTQESLKLSMSIAATLHAMARQTLPGLSHISTTVHPGWPGEGTDPAPLVISMFNASRSTIQLGESDRFCRMLFFQLASEATALAPTPQTVQRLLGTQLQRIQQKHSRSRTLLGWILIVALLLVATVTLWALQTYFPAYAAISIALIVTVLTMLLGYVRKKFGIFQQDSL